ncbi:MAG: two-component regulator propeller domain-containing protein [Tenacibaculum sp.]
MKTNCKLPSAKILNPMLRYYSLLKIKLCLLCYLSIFALCYGQSKPNFVHINPSYNNNIAYVYKIAQDSLGLVWMATNKGILKYNGYSYSFISGEEIFKNFESADKIDDIITDSKHNIWIKTSKGLLCKYVWSKGVFHDFSDQINQRVSKIKCRGDELWMVTQKGIVKRYLNNIIEDLAKLPKDKQHSVNVYNIAFAYNNQVYFGTTNGNIYNYSIEQKKLTELKGVFTNYPTILTLEVDAKNRLWIGTEAQGLLIYDIESASYIENDFFKGEKHKIDKAIFLDLFLDSKQNIWAATDGNGLYKVNTTNGKVSVYKKNNLNLFSLESNTLRCISEDNSQNIWMITKNFNINVLPKTNEYIKFYNGNADKFPARVLSIFKDDDNLLWIGSDGEGLTSIKNNKATQYFNQTDNNFYIQSITGDNLSNLWIGTYKNGLWHYDKKSKKFKKIRILNKLNQLGTDVRIVFKDSKGRIWAASNVSINIYDRNKKLIASFDNQANGLSGLIVTSIVEDKKGNIWLGQQKGGLYKFAENSADIDKSLFVNFNIHEEEPIVTSMCLGKDNQLWILTSNNNILLFDTLEKKIQNYNHLIPNKDFSLLSLLRSDSSNIWIGSNQGLIHFNTQKQTIRTFNTSDGLRTNKFLKRSAFKDKQGVLYFGSTKGVHFFDPKELKKKKTRVKLAIINDIQVLNKPAKEILPKQITSDISNIERLQLSNNQSSFSVRFSAIGNILHPSHYYEYRLKGFDKQWKMSYSEGFAEYTNLPSGNYILEIKAIDIDHKKQVAQKILYISIAPPFWNTPLAYIIYILLIVLPIWGLIKWYYLKKKLLINKISRRKEKELHKSKMNFFTKMSHEIQTPITLILGPIGDMLKQSELNGNMLLKERLRIIANNAKRLSDIARELTFLRNKELNRLKLTVSKINLFQHISCICLSFKELARSKKIDFSVNCPKNLTQAWYDKDKFEHVIYNLLSNAFKHAPVEGSVQLQVLVIDKSDLIKITVTDSGLGIKKEELNKIFKIFYRTKDNLVKGTGIGLALTKELVLLHKGKIKVSSIPNEGTTFSVQLPISEKSYCESEKKLLSNNKKQQLQSVKITASTKEQSEPSKTNKSILIVEDNFELQMFLKKLLEKKYNLLLANNGKEGYYQAKNYIPDLIISDIVMPKMDGIEMCKELNKNSLTKHVPIILLTAKNSTRAKIEGLKTGAIEYLNKPFNTNELLLKIANILLAKENILSKYRKELIKKPNIKISKSPDEEFLEKLTSHINKRLEDSNFKVDELAYVINMSYSSLYRKCLSLTGYNLIDYIKIIRLKKAAILLAKYGYNISETAYRVGFNNPKYFSKSFKKQFRITPKEFKSKACNIEDIQAFLKIHSYQALVDKTTNKI